MLQDHTSRRSHGSLNIQIKSRILKEISLDETNPAQDQIKTFNIKQLGSSISGSGSTLKSPHPKTLHLSTIFLLCKLQQINIIYC